jgi:hypothetical protein
MTTTHAHDPGTGTAALPPLPVCALLIAAWNLLDETHDLPHPTDVGVSDTQSIDLRFPPGRSSYRSIARWAARFGGTVISSKPIDTEHGPRIYCRCEFSYHGLAVDAWAVIAADKAA